MNTRDDNSRNTPLPGGIPQQNQQGRGEQEQGQPQQRSGLTPSTAENASFETGAGEANLGFDSPPVASETLSNTEYHAGTGDPMLGPAQESSPDPDNDDG